MKKVLSIVLSLSMVLGSFGLAFAATPNVASKFSDVNGKNCEEAVKVLSDLSVVTGYDDGTYKPENIVTRAEMAVLVVNALGLQNYVTTASKSSFKDMDGYGWAEGYISYAQSAGIISGYGDGTFKPGKTVSYDEAATMLVAALGYTPASLQGSWPANYVTKAKSLGILDDVKAGPEGANRGDTAVMLYQTIDQKIGFVDKNNVWTETQGKQIAVPGYKDKVNAGDKMIYRLGAAPEDTQIDSIVTGDEDSDINLTPYVGMCATKYYKNNKIIAITDIQSTFIKGSFSGKDIAAFSGDDDVDYTISLPNTSANSHSYDSWDQVQYFYNGQPASKDQLIRLGFVYNTNAYPNQLSHLDSDSGAKELDATIAVKDTGKTLKTLYSVSIWDYTNQGAARRATQADVNALKNDKTLLGQDFTTLKDGSIDPNSYALTGVKSLSDIAVDNIVFVYTKKVTNNDMRITKVAVSQDTVKGEITKTSTNKSKYTIDGKDYKVTNGKGFDYGVGDTVKAYLDPDGKIFDMDNVSSTADNYAIVLKDPDGTGTYDRTYKVKLFTKDGNTTTFEFKDKAAFDTNFTNVETVNQPHAGDLVTYDLNSAGKITSLTKKTANNGQPLQGKVNNGVVGGRQLADNAVIFTVDRNGAGNNNLENMSFDTINVKNIDKDTNIKDSYSPAISGRYATGKNGDIKALIIDQRASGANNSYGFIDSVKIVKNSKGEKAREITAFIDGKKVTVQTDSEMTYVDSYTDDPSTLFRFAFNGDLVKDVFVQNKFLAYGPGGAKPDDITKDNVMIANSGDWQQVNDVRNGDLKLGSVGSLPNTGTFQAVKGAKAYLATFDRDGGFDSYQIGSVDNINTGDVVTMFQTNKNSSTVDLVVYVKRSDAGYATSSSSDFTFKTANGSAIDAPTTAPSGQYTTAVFGNTGKATSGAIEIGNGLTVSAIIAPKMSGSNPVEGNYVVTPTFGGTATNKADVTITLSGTDVSVDNTPNSHTQTAVSIAAGVAGSTLNPGTAFNVVSTKGMPVLDLSGKSDVHYNIAAATSDTVGDLTIGSKITAISGNDGTLNTDATSKADQMITATVTYTAPSPNGKVVFELYNGEELLKASNPTDVSGASTLDLEFKMPAKDVTLTAKAVEVNPINAGFTDSTYFGTFKDTNDITATVTSPITGYAGEKQDVDVHIYNASPTGGFVTVTLRGTDIKTDSKRVAVGSGRSVTVTFQITVPSNDVNDLKLDVTASTN